MDLLADLLESEVPTRSFARPWRPPVYSAIEPDLLSEFDVERANNSGSNTKVLFSLSDRRQWHPSGAAAPAISSAYRSATRLVPRANYVGPDPWDTPEWRFAPPGYKDKVLRQYGRQVPAGKSLGRAVPRSVGFDDPFKVLICLQRKIRREVLLAFGLGGSHPGRRRQSYYSGVRCW